MPTTTVVPNTLSAAAEKFRWRDLIGRALLRLIPAIQRQKRESLEIIVARSIDRAFAEFAKEMGRC
jgi:hypothetical protein